MNMPVHVFTGRKTTYHDRTVHNNKKTLTIAANNDQGASDNQQKVLRQQLLETALSGHSIGLYANQEGNAND